MKSAVTIFVLCLAIVKSNPRPKESYTSKFDNIDVDEILHSERLLKNYMNCLLDKGRCTPDGKELKDNLPDAMENGCSKCSEYQNNTGQKVLKFLVEKKRDYYDQLEAKYDPEGKYRNKYQDDLKEAGIKL
nr:chemosensory protein 11 [Pachyrhinus yasumatsui]